jgi:hypothetical protein
MLTKGVSVDVACWSANYAIYIEGNGYADPLVPTGT